MVREFFAWWFGQLADLLPQGLRRSALNAADALVITPIGPLGHGAEAVVVDLRRNGKETSLGHFRYRCRRLGGTAPHRRDDRACSASANSEVLAKTVTLPLAAERELDQVLAFEMDRETPFKAEELYWTHRDNRGRPAERAVVGAPLAGPESERSTRCSTELAAGRNPARPVEISDGPDKGASLPLNGNGSRAHHASARLLWPAAACCAALAIAAVVTPFVRQELALQRRSSARSRRAAPLPPRPTACARRSIVCRAAPALSKASEKRPGGRWSCWRRRPGSCRTTPT